MVKCIEDEIPFELPEGWAWSRVQTIASVKGGKRVPKGYSVTDEKTNHAYIRVTDMKNNTISLDSLKFISDEVYSKISTYVISKNDLYVTIAGTIGNVGEVPDELDGMNLTENAVKVCNISIDKSYLCKVLSSDFVQKQFRFQTHQVTMAKLALERILDTLIPIAPLYEQNRINHRVFELTKQIEELQCSKYKLQSLITSTKSKILDLAIRGKLVPQDPNDEPASVLLERIRAEKEELIKQGKIKRDKKESVIFKGDDNSYYEEIPENWICCDVKSVMQYIRNGATIKQSKDATGIPITRIETISQEFIDYTKMGYANIFAVDNYQSFVLNSGDILMSHINSPKHLCKCAIYNHTEKNEVVLHGMNLLSLRPVVHETSKFLLYMFRSSEFKAYVYENMKHSVNQASITATDIGNYTFLLPPLAEQKRIVEAIETAFAQLDEILNSIS